MPGESRIGYIGVDVLNNTTVCNEALGLLRAGVPLEIVSIHPRERSAFYQDTTQRELRGRVETLSPIKGKHLVFALLSAPLIFGWRFWSMLTRAIFAPAEGMRQRLQVIYQTIPALLLAQRWRRRGIRHIHAHWGHAATAVAMHTAELLGVGFSFTGHGNDLFLHQTCLKDKLRRARFTVCVSEYHRRYYLDLGADPSRLEVVYCGIDVDHFSEEAAAVPKAIPARIVAVGRLFEKKGFADLVTACALLEADDFDFECLIAGSGPEQYDLAQMIQEHNLEGIVRLTGTTPLQEDLPILLASSLIFALPCVRDRDGAMDGLPQVLIESLACGIPVVSTRLAGIPDLIRDGTNGLLIEPGDVRGLALALGRLLKYPQLATHLGEQGQSWVREHFGRDESVHRLASLFRWAAATPGLSPPETAWPAAPGACSEYPERVLTETAL